VSRLLALLRKELAQHWLAMLALYGLAGVGMFILVAGASVEEEITSRIVAHARFMLVLLPMLVAVLGHRMIVVEYYGRTQLFLEALPLRRSEMLSIKILFGASVVLSLSFASLGVALLSALRTEPITITFVGILSLRSLMFSLWLWSFAFFMAMLGRLRWLGYILIGFLVHLIQTRSSLELSRFGPFALASLSLLPFERVSHPSQALLESVLFTGLLAAAGFALGLVKEGGLAESLSRRMAPREKAALTLVTICGMVVLSTIKDKQQKEPFQFSQKSVLRSADRRLQVLHDGRHRADAQALLHELAGLTDTLAKHLAVKTLPVLHIALRQDLDGRTFERAGLRDRDGILLRANYLQAPGWDRRGFSAFALHSLLAKQSHSRALYEPEHWFLDGYALWLASDGRVEAHRAALVAQRFDKLEVAQFRSWSLTREAHGDPVSSSLAALAIELIAARSGTQPVVDLARAHFAMKTYGDSRDMLQRWLHPFESQLKEHTKLTLSELAAALSKELARRRSELSKTPVFGATATLTLRREEGSLRRLVVTTSFPKPPPPGTLVTVLHSALPPFDWELYRPLLKREERVWEPGGVPPVELSGRYGPGARVFIAVDVEVPGAPCYVRLLATRRTIR